MTPTAGPADRRTLEGLEFHAVLRLIAPHLRTPPGRAALASLLPSGDPTVVARRKELAGDAMRHRVEEGRVGPGAVDDVQPVLERLRPEGSVLEGIDVSRLLGVLRAAATLRRTLSAERSRYPALGGLAAEIPDLTPLTRLIEGRVAADGRLEDGASPDLAAARRRIAQLEATLQRRLQETLERAAGEGLLQDRYITVRHARFVIPLRAEARGRLPGFLHGASSTGATVFVEPLETLELNNDLVAEQEREQAEVRRILTAWSAALRLRLDDLERAVSRVGAIDLLGAIAEFGVEGRCVLAADSSPGAASAWITLEQARHPVLEAGLASRGGEAVPLGVELPGASGALVLSGPNAGGKTVAMKTIGLLVLMNQAGLPVPAARAVLPLFRQVLADIGDHQSIEESLSTFSARMVRVAEMAGALAPPALVLLDEVGSGTDPEEAGALAVAIVDHFRRSGATVVATTHHEPLKGWAQTTPGALNASMEIDEATMRPTYQLRAGIAGRSGGLDVARRVGLPEAIVTDARSRLSPAHLMTRESIAHLEKLAEEKEEELERIRGQREQERREHEAARTASEARLVELERTWREAIAAALDRVERAREEFLGAIQDRAIELQIRAESRRQARRLREQVESSTRPPVARTEGAARVRESPIRMAPGDRVRWRGMKGVSEGVVESIDDRGRAGVRFGGKRVSVPLTDLEALSGPPAPPAAPRRAPPAGVRLQRGAAGSRPSAELNLIGARVEEALDRLDKFLDDAYLDGHAQVRIVHGHGTGRLREAVRKMLAGHPHVASLTAADEQQGGDGATEVALRD